MPCSSPRRPTKRPCLAADSLDGWTKVGGGATYTVSEGVITGRTGEGKNTFLTRGPYSNFILEFDVKCDPELNSGSANSQSPIRQRNATGIESQQEARKKAKSTATNWRFGGPSMVITVAPEISGTKGAGRNG